MKLDDNSKIEICTKLALEYGAKCEEYGELYHKLIKKDLPSAPLACTITKRINIDKWKKESGRGRYSFGIIDQDDERFIVEPTYYEDIEWVKELIPEERRPFFNDYLNGMETFELAQKYELSMANTWKIIQRITKKIKQNLKDGDK